MTFLAAQYDTALGYTAQGDRQLVGSIFQNGVIGAGDLLASAGTGFNSQIASGSGAITGTVESSSGRYLVTNIGAVTALHSTPDGTNSRLDTLYIKVYDSRDGGDASDTVLPVIVPGTPQAGNPSSATLLASRAGVGAVPSNALLIADVYVPHAAASAASFTYRDRRPWATGAYVVMNGRTSGDYSTASITYAVIDATNLQARVECSGVPLELIFHYAHSNDAGGSNPQGGVRFQVDGSLVGPTHQHTATAGSNLFYGGDSVLHHVILAPTPGSHLIAPYFAVINGAGVYVAGSAPFSPATFIIREQPAGGNGTS